MCAPQTTFSTCAALQFLTPLLQDLSFLQIMFNSYVANINVLVRRALANLRGYLCLTSDPSAPSGTKCTTSISIREQNVQLGFVFTLNVFNQITISDFYWKKVSVCKRWRSFMYTFELSSTGSKHFNLIIQFNSVSAGFRHRYRNISSFFDCHVVCRH